MWKLFKIWIGTAGKQPRQSGSPFCNFLILDLKNIITMLLNLVTCYLLLHSNRIEIQEAFEHSRRSRRVGPPSSVFPLTSLCLLSENLGLFSANVVDIADLILRIYLSLDLALN